MKITLRVLLVVILGMLPLLTLLHLVQERLGQAQAAAIGMGPEVAWPEGERFADPQIAATVLGDAARSVGHNLIRTVVATAPDGATAIAYYVLLVSPTTTLWDRLPLAEGRWPTASELADSSAWAGTVAGEGSPTGSETEVYQSRMVGSVAALGSGYRVTVQGMDVLLRRVPAAGGYVLEGASASEESAFRHAAAAELSARLGTSVSDSEFTMQRAIGASSEARDPLTLVVPVGLIAAILACGLVVRTARSFGVLRLHGYSGLRLWLRAAGYPLVPAGILAAVVIGALGLSLPGMSGDDVLELAGVQLGATTGVLVIASGVTWLVLVRLDIPTLMKGAVQ